jgi:methionine-rich copper-binding protein CopC
VRSKLAAFAGLAVLMVLSALPAASVGAHADLIRADPAPDSRLAQSPAQLTLYFSQGLKQAGSHILVEDASGTRQPVQLSFHANDAKVMRASLGTLQPGIYKVLWQTLSADDDDYHDGSYQLTVLNPNGSAPSGAPSSGDSGGDDVGSSRDMLMLVIVSVVVVVGIGGLAYYIRAQGRAAR